MINLPAVYRVDDETYLLPTRDDAENYARIQQSFTVTHEDAIPVVLSFRAATRIGHMPDHGMLARMCDRLKRMEP